MWYDYVVIICGRICGTCRIICGKIRVIICGKICGKVNNATQAGELTRDV